MMCVGSSEEIASLLYEQKHLLTELEKRDLSDTEIEAIATLWNEVLRIESVKVKAVEDNLGQTVYNMLIASDQSKAMMIEGISLPIQKKLVQLIAKATVGSKERESQISSQLINDLD